MEDAGRQSILREYPDWRTDFWLMESHCDDIVNQRARTESRPYKLLLSAARVLTNIKRLTIDKRAVAIARRSIGVQRHIETIGRRVA